MKAFDDIFSAVVRGDVVEIRYQPLIRINIINVALVPALVELSRPLAYALCVRHGSGVQQILRLSCTFSNILPTALRVRSQTALGTSDLGTG